MLTNIYYYNHYRPYTVKENEVIKEKLKLYSQSNRFKEKGFLLNKSCRSDVISFIKNISFSITGLREAAKKLEETISKIQQYNWFRSHYNERLWLKEEFADFVTYFNEAYKYAFYQEHCAELTNFASNIMGLVAYGLETGNGYRGSFVSMDDDNHLIFDEDKFDKTNLKRILHIAFDFKAVVHDVKYETDYILEMPLSTYMNFKTLSYYYNYKFGDISDNTFKIIENGTLYDVIV